MPNITDTDVNINKIDNISMKIHLDLILKKLSIDIDIILRY